MAMRSFTDTEVNVLRPQSYISLESAMVNKGITSQSPSVLTCVTPGYPHSFRAKSVGLVYRKISSRHYWGYEEKATRYNKYFIAEPEKALLDWIYLNRQEGLPTPFDELQLQFLNLAKLRQYAERFPRTVREVIEDLLIENAFPLKGPEQIRRNRGRSATNVMIGKSTNHVSAPRGPRIPMLPLNLAHDHRAVVKPILIATSSSKAPSPAGAAKPDEHAPRTYR